jgi:hypothetical protein
MNPRKLSRDLATSVLRCTAVLLIVTGLGGCTLATPLGPVAGDFVPNEHEGMIYGRMELVINGNTVQSSSAFTKTSVIVHVSHFVSDDQLNTNAFRPGEFSFRAYVTGDGRFAAKLPVGRYYCVEFAYVGVPVGRTSMAGWRTYAEIPGETLGRRSVVTFDVLPNKATYVGHLRHHLDIEHSFRKDHVQFDMDLANDTGQDTAWLLEQHPGLKGATVSRLLVREPLIASAP